MATSLRRWLYLDRKGIANLYHQAYGGRLVEAEATRTAEHDTMISGKAAAGIYGIGVEGGGEFRRAQHHEVTRRITCSEERDVLDVEAFLAANEGIRRIGGAKDIALLLAAKESAFVTGVLQFRWKRTHCSDVVEDAIAKQMLEFVLDRDAHDDAGSLAVDVLLAGSLEKCDNARPGENESFSPNTHLAIFLRQFGKGALPLGFLAQLQPLNSLVYLKPYAIWYP